MVLPLTPTDCSAPFIVGVFTDTAADAGSAARPNRGEHETFDIVLIVVIFNMT